MILVWVAGTEDLLIEKLRKWKKDMELKGRRINSGKEKVLRCQVSRGQAVDSRNHPYVVCRHGCWLQFYYVRCVSQMGSLKVQWYLR